MLPSLSSSGVTSLLSRAGEPAVRGDVLEGRTAASEGLAAELLQRSAVTCSEVALGAACPRYPPPQGPWWLELHPAGGWPGGCAFVLHFKVSV